MKSLVLTLGHNSSAIMVEDGHIRGGYEEERLSGIKSDSAFPILAIKKLKKLYDLPDDIAIYVSHWFLDGEINLTDKHWGHESIGSLFPNSTIFDLDPGNDFTHHKAHALSAEVFAGEDFPINHHILVADGFGTGGECYTAYKNDVNGLKRVFSYHGFFQSIGLFYQYATAFCGMKMHQHEYKMLGYETHIDEIIPCPYKIQFINGYIDEFSLNTPLHDIYREIDLNALKAVQGYVDEALRRFLYVIEYTNSCIRSPYEERVKRILVSYFTQRHTENIIKRLIKNLNPISLIVVGGVFFNVKINKMIADMIPGMFCAMPLAGDQGAGLGVYQYYNGDLVWPEHLFWGHRDLRVSACDGIINEPNIGTLKDTLYHDGVINVVRGSMEFGPRALCNTSTLAKPTLEMAALINKMNGRTNEMPFALVVTPKQAMNLFKGVAPIHKSLEYMIVTREFRPGKEQGLLGGAHYYPLTREYTCRPQITTDPFMVELLEEFGPLINTSFNYHGCPIVWQTEQIENSHLHERKEFPIKTFLF